MATAASVPGSPLHPLLPPGVEPQGPFAWLARALGVAGLHGSALVSVGVAAVVLATGGFLLMLREAWRGTVSLRTVVILAVAAQAVILTLPLLISRDVYSYIAYGNIAGLHHANPYVQTPAGFPLDAVSSLVGPKWFSTPAVYGPLFTAYASVVVRTVHALSAQVETFRWTAAVAGLGTIAVIATTVRRTWPSRARVRRRGVRAEPRAVVPDGGERSQRRPGGARGGGRVRARAGEEGPARGGRSRARDARQGDGGAAARAAPGVVRGAGPRRTTSPHARHSRRPGRGDRRGVRGAVLPAARPHARDVRACGT